MAVRTSHFVRIVALKVTGALLRKASGDLIFRPDNGVNFHEDEMNINSATNAKWNFFFAHTVNF